VLFADGAGRELRGWMMDVGDLHTILRLPTGIFYAPGVKTNVLFLRRGPARVSKGNTQAVWVYDMRAGQPAYGKERRAGHLGERRVFIGSPASRR
jgi:type I restriction enzyme M protein